MPGAYSRSFLAIDFTKEFLATILTKSKIQHPHCLRLLPLGAAL